MLGCVGRGGNAQAIRDEILNIMHRNHIGEKRGTWMEVPTFSLSAAQYFGCGQQTAAVLCFWTMYCCCALLFGNILLLFYVSLAFRKA